MRLVDADGLAEELSERVWYEREDEKQAVRIVKESPTVDAVAVVRCKDCRYSYDDMGGLCCSHGVCVDCVVPRDFFCSYGERKGGDE